MIKLVIFDFDGVFTNGNINIGSKNIVSYNVKDGQALKLLRDNNINYGCISSFKFSFDNLYLRENTKESYIYKKITPREVIFKHLKFKYYSIGESNKIHWFMYCFQNIIIMKMINLSKRQLTMINI